MSSSTHDQFVCHEGTSIFIHSETLSFWRSVAFINTSKWCRNVACAQKLKKEKQEIRIHRVGVIKMNQTYRPSLDSSETLYEWNFCVSLHYAVFKWPLSICSCAIRSSRSHFQRRLRESCSACLLIMQHPELNTALPFFFSWEKLKCVQWSHSNTSKCYFFLAVSQ